MMNRKDRPTYTGKPRTARASELPREARDFLRKQLKTRSGQALLGAIIQSVIEGAIMEGRIDPRGKEPAQLTIEVRDLLLQLKALKEPLEVSTDFRPTLLREARRQASMVRHDLAFMFYATWLEHWANHLIINLGRRKRLTERELKTIVRESPFRAKFSWVLTLLGLPPIPDKHLRCINDIADIRNSFVHYKWGSDFDKPSYKGDAKLAVLVRQTDSTIKYLSRYENKHLFHGFKHKIHPVITLQAGASSG